MGKRRVKRIPPDPSQVPPLSQPTEDEPPEPEPTPITCLFCGDKGDTYMLAHDGWGRLEHLYFCLSCDLRLGLRPRIKEES